MFHISISSLIKVTPCFHLVASQACTTGTFTCPSNGQCIPIIKVCDFINDCPDASDETSCGTCNFETSTCGWTDGLYYGFEWIRKTGPSSTLSGPQIDHTLQTSAGSYLGTRRKDNLDGMIAAPLNSPTFGQLASTCKISFWAHLGDPGLVLRPHQIDVYVSNKAEIFEYTGTAFGPTGSNWVQYRLNVGARPAGYIITMWGFNFNSIANDVMTEIGLDDVIFENCGEITPAPDETFPCSDGSFLSSSRVCDFIKDCISGNDEAVCGNCDFEKSFCNWFDDSPNTLQWKRGQAGSSSTTGPTIDHTLGNATGSYAYVAAGQGNLLSWADLVLDKNLGPSSTTCDIEFFYHMKGDTDDLILYAATNYGGAVRYVYIFEFLGDAGDQWNKAIINLGRIKESYRLIFSAERSYTATKNDIAIDDVKLFNCEYPEGNFGYNFIIKNLKLIFCSSSTKWMPTRLFYM